MEIKTNAGNSHHAIARDRLFNFISVFVREILGQENFCLQRSSFHVAVDSIGPFAPENLCHLLCLMIQDSHRSD